MSANPQSAALPSTDAAPQSNASGPWPPSQPVRAIVDYELLFDCVHCGLCLESCPTYVLTRAEMDSPRGRVYLMKALAEGSLQLDGDVVRHLDLCLECRGCETACPSGVHYGRLIEKARAYVNRNYRRGLGERIRNRLINAIFPYPARLRVLLAPLRLAERAGLRPLLRRLVPRAMSEWLDLLPPLGADTAAHPTAPPPENIFAPGREAAPDAPTVAVHHGCVAQVLCDSANRNSERALAAAGFRVVPLGPTVCCGALDLHVGNIDRALKLARANVRAIKHSGAESIVSAAAGCSAAMAQYGELLKDDADLAEDARQVAVRVADLSSLILGARENPFARTEYSVTVTYHDSCHLAHVLGVRDTPRRLLSSIPGVRLVEMAESDLCCGSAGTYNLTEPVMAARLARRKADNIIAAGADFVVLSNPGCELHIRAELRRRAARTRVIHLADFLALAATQPR